MSVRCSAVRALRGIAETGGPAAFDAYEAILDAARDVHAPVREQVARELRFFPGAQTVAVLVEALWDPDPHGGVQGAAVWTLLDIGRAAAPALVAALPRAADNPVAMECLVRALGGLHDAELANLVVDALSHPSAAVRSRAAVQLGDLCGPGPTMRMCSRKRAWAVLSSVHVPGHHKPGGRGAGRSSPGQLSEGPEPRYRSPGGPSAGGRRRGKS